MIRVLERPDVSLERFHERLTARNWNWLNEGSWGTVFARGKLVWRIEYAGIRSIANISYHRYVMALAGGRLDANSPHAPRIKMHLVFRDGVATLMERLDCTLEETDYKGSDDLEIPEDFNPSLAMVMSDVIDWLGEVPHSLARYVEGIMDLNIGHMDLHTGNLMFRGSTLVVTDPVC